MTLACREALRDMDKLNRIASPLVQVSNSFSGGSGLKCPARQSGTYAMSTSETFWGQAFYNGDPDIVTVCLSA